MRTLTLIFLALSIVGCTANEKSLGTRIKGHGHLKSLTETVDTNLDIVIAGYHARMSELYRKVNTKAFAEKLKALADANGRADVREVAKLIEEWQQVKATVREELKKLKDEAVTVKHDIAKIKVIIAALEDLAQTESASSELTAAHLASIMSRISEAAPTVTTALAERAAQKQKEEEEKEFEELVRSMEEGEE